MARLAHRPNWWSGVAGALTILLVLGAAVPSVLLWRTAAANAVALSLPAYFNGPDGGTTAPSVTETYATVDGVDLKVDVWQAEATAGPRPGHDLRVRRRLGQR